MSYCRVVFFNRQGGKIMNTEKLIVRLSEEERQELQTIIKKL